jgi:phosphoribosylanthranilate isomerase
MFRIKICGVTNLDDARTAIDAGADALGFNFYRASKRFIDRESARQIISIFPSTVSKVGVFVDHPVCDVQETAERLELDYVQLHGNEPPVYLSELPASLQIVRAYRCGSNGLAPLSSYLNDCQALGRLPHAVLLDADVSGSFGGTGRTVDWSEVVRQRSVLGDIRLILAGGLTATNVGQAIATVHPDAVDVASGVERQPGMKDDGLMRHFVAAAREAFARI